MRIFIVTLSPSANVTEPVKFDRDNCLWLDASNLEGICTGLADAYQSWLLKFGADVTEFQVRAVDMHGKPAAVVGRVVKRPRGER